MKVYFLSSRPCALTLNGVYFGITDSFERYVEVCPDDKIYAQFAPEGALPIGFFLTESLFRSPPDGCEIYLLRDGVAVYAKEFPPADFTLRSILQERAGDCLVTVFSQGQVQVSVEGPHGFFCAPLPPSFQPSKILLHEGYVLLEGDGAFALYTPQCECLLFERFIEYSLTENQLNATLPLSDRLGRRAECAWTLTGGACRLSKFSLQQPTHDGAPPSDLLAYAFFESVLIGADFSVFLADALIPDAENIRAFLGDFSGVTLTDTPTVCGLVRKKADRLFAVDYFAVEIREGKIIDVKG